MTQVENPQMLIGQLDIACNGLGPESRDDIPQILRGLQHIFTTPVSHDEVFHILDQVISRNEDGDPVSANTGCPGRKPAGRSVGVSNGW